MLLSFKGFVKSFFFHRLLDTYTLFFHIFHIYTFFCHFFAFFLFLFHVEPTDNLKTLEFVGTSRCLSFQ